MHACSIGHYIDSNFGTENLQKTLIYHIKKKLSETVIKPTHKTST
jgi:hypothetical protein